MIKIDSLEKRLKQELSRGDVVLFLGECDNKKLSYVGHFDSIKNDEAYFTSFFDDREIGGEAIVHFSSGILYQSLTDMGFKITDYEILKKHENPIPSPAQIE